MKQIVLLALLACPLAARAQQADSSAPAATPADSAFLRARQLVVGGNGTAGRAVVDSVLAAASPGTPAYAQALYWRASLASSAATAEHDYERLIVDYPFSPHTADALYALAQLETSRGDRSGAVAHLRRLLLEHPTFPERARAGLALGRLLLDLGQLPKGCAVLLRTRAGVPASSVELLNQIDYYASRCEGVDTATVATAPTKPGTRATAESTGTRASRADSGRATRVRAEPPRSADTSARTVDTSAKRTTTRTRERREPKVERAERKPAARETAKFTVQVAAYDTRADAERLVTRLRARGLDARVVGTAKPFRVRVGRFDARSAAVTEAKRLKAKGIDGFVTTEPEGR